MLGSWQYCSNSASDNRESTVRNGWYERDTASAIFGDEDTPVIWIVLDIEFLEDFVEDCSCGGTITDIDDTRLPVFADEFRAILGSIMENERDT